jgi:hypothetical protein
VPEFTTLANVRAALGVPSGVTRHDARINLYLSGIDAEILGLIGQAGFTSQTYSETYDVDGPRESALPLRHWPVTNVAAVTNDGSAVSLSDVYVDPDSRSTLKLKGSGSFFVEGRQKVQVTYTAGQAIPGDLTVAATLLVAAKVNAGGHAGLESESSNGYDYKRATSSLPPEVAAVIAKYRPLFR